MAGFRSERNWLRCSSVGAGSSCPQGFQRFADWQVEKVAIATSLLSEAHQAIETAGFLPQSLADLTEGLQA